MFISDLISQIGWIERYEPSSTATGYPRNAPLWQTHRGKCLIKITITATRHQITSEPKTDFRVTVFVGEASEN